MKTAQSVTTCDDLVTTYFAEVVTSTTRALYSFAAWCDDRDDLFPCIYASCGCARRAHIMCAYLIYVVTVVTYSNNHKRIKGLRCDDLPEKGRHKVVTGRHTLKC